MIIFAWDDPPHIVTDATAAHQTLEATPTETLDTVQNVQTISTARQGSQDLMMILTRNFRIKAQNPECNLRKSFLE